MCVRMSFYLAVAAFTANVIAVVASETIQETFVRVPNVGLLQGLQHAHGVRVFARVPYAQPPLNDLRWRPPKPLPMSDLNIDARSFGPACSQLVGGHVIGEEDCLTLNIFAPISGNRSGSLTPVVVWFHGGDFVLGTANIHLSGSWAPIYDGRSMAAKGVVVVTVQYRLGPLGFLGSSQLRSRDASGSSGNYGIQDQRLALHWVQQHISTVGGDPRRVLIFGQSAGAGSVSWHLVAKASHGLFHAAALQSGACAPWSSQTLQQAEASFEAVLVRANCTSVGCLLKRRASELLYSTAKRGAQALGWAPTVDGVEVDELPCTKMMQGSFSKVPIIVGFNRDESAPDGNIDMRESEFDEILERKVPKYLHRKVKAQYRALDSAWFWAAQHLQADMGISCPTRRFVRAAVSAGVPVFAYKFSRSPGIDVLQRMYGRDATATFSRQQWGAFHGAELPFVFGNPRIDEWDVNLNEEDQKLASIISHHWVQFAKTGRPSKNWPEVGGRDALSANWLLLDSPNISSSEAQILSQCDTFEQLEVRGSHFSAGQPQLLIM